MYSEYQPFMNMKFDYNHCFVCGVELTNKNKTDEHVIPAWLQNKHALWDQKLKLTNGSSIPYRFLKIPCCQECNNQSLNEIEKKIQKASRSYEEFIKLDKWTIFIWLVKLYYGLKFKDLSLAIDLREPNKGKLNNPEQLSKFKMLHEFLQMTRRKISFTTEVFSLFIYQLHLDPRNDKKYDFNFGDDISRSQIAIQIGEIGIICCIGEDGIIAESLGELLNPFKDHKLHSIQFQEIVARVFYQRALLQIPPQYLLLNSKNETHIVSNMNSYSGIYFKNPKSQEYAHFLTSRLKRFGVHFEDLYKADADAVNTYLLKPNGNLYLLDSMGVPIADIEIKHPLDLEELFNV